MAEHPKFKSTGGPYRPDVSACAQNDIANLATLQVRRDCGRPDRRGGGEPLLHPLHLPPQQDRPGRHTNSIDTFCCSP